MSDERRNLNPSSSDSPEVEKYIVAVEAAQSARVFDGKPGLERLSEGNRRQVRNEAGNRIVEFTETSNRLATALEKQVFMDNSVGKVYPGALLWAMDIRAQRLNQLPRIDGRPSVRTSFTLVRNIAPSPEALVFDHDGTYSDFLRGAARVFGAVGSGGIRLTTDFKVSTSIDEALLGVGLSARGWGSSLKSGLDLANRESRTVAVLSLDQTFYSAAMDIPDIKGIIPIDLLRENRKLASVLANAVDRNGEIVYVRKVDYGRRILVSLSAEASSEELDAAMKATINWVGGGLSTDLDAKTKKVWESIEGKMIVIGGKFPQGVNGFFSGRPEAFGATVQAIMSPDFVNSTEGGLPVSFELAYASDNAPMQVFETVEFSGRIPGRAWGLTPFEPEGGGMTLWTDEARIISGDGEMDADDWTLCSLVKQRVYISSDRRDLRMEISWQAREGTHRQTFKDSWFESAKDVLIYRAPPGSAIRSFLPPDGSDELQTWSAPRQDVWLGGHIVNMVVPVTTKWGFLRNVKVQVDASGNRDQLSNKLFGGGLWQIWVQEED